jgi:hypothetical protein
MQNCKCNNELCQFWDQSNCHFIPDFKIDSNGKLENLLCGFLFWLRFSGFPEPTGENLDIVNGNSLFPPEMQYAISIVSKEGIPNLIDRYENFLEAIRDSLI